MNGEQKNNCKRSLSLMGISFYGEMLPSGDVARQSDSTDEIKEAIGGKSDGPNCVVAVTNVSATDAI